MKKLFTSVTDTPSEILQEWSEDKSKGYSTGVWITACRVFSLCDGVVMYANKYDSKHYGVTIQYSSNLYIRYMNLSSIADIHPGSPITKGTPIGEVNSKLLIEACTNSVSMWPVRIGKVTVYKNDPMDYLDGSYFSNQTFREDATYKSFDSISLDDQMMREFDGK